MEGLLNPVDETVGLFATPENTEFPFQRTYRSLSSNRKEIRLVEILPGSPDQKISLNLIHGCFLTEIAHTFYEALSYCVGDVTKYRKVVFEGHEFDVFESLYNALSQLRPKANTSSRVVWIDQLCIHQHDLQEKSWQIGLMKTIYEESSNVLSWLGPSSVVPDSCLAFEFVDEFWQLYGENIVNTSEALVPNCSSFKEVSSRFLRGFKNDGAISRFNRRLIDTTVNTEDIVHLLLRCDNLCALQNLSSLALKIDAFFELLRRPYWTRKWILQEVSAAKDGLLLCGENSMNILIFFITYALLGFRVDLDIQNGKSFEGDVDWYVEKILHIRYSGEMHDFLNFWVFAQTTIYYSLIDSLYLTRNLSATDPRDRVYALLSTADPKEIDRLGILPDYSNGSSVSNLISNICKQYVTSDRSSRGYSLDQANGIWSRHEIPSWCFDFTIESLKQPGRGSMQSVVMKQGYQNASLIQDSGNLLLVIEGVFLGVVQETSTITYPNISRHDAYWLESTQTKFLEKELPLLLDWMEESTELSNLAPIELRDILSELLELLMDNTGQLEIMADAVDELSESSPADDFSLQLTYLAGLLLSLFSQLEGNYYRWQLACLRLDNLNLRFEDQGVFSSPNVEEFAPNIATLGTDTSVKENEAVLSTASDLLSHDLRGKSCESEEPHGIRTSGSLEGCGVQIKSEGQISVKRPLQSSMDKCKEYITYATGAAKQLDTKETLSPCGRLDGDTPACTLGVVQTPTQAGDQIFVEASGLTIFVLRSQSRTQNGCAVYKLVGKCELSGCLVDQKSLKDVLKMRETLKVAIA